MKVLWFANTPCGATEKLTGKPVTGGGWLGALAEALIRQKGVELHIAFYYDKNMDAFEYKGIIYHPVYREGYGSRLGRYIIRLRQQFDDSVDKHEIERLFDVYKMVLPDLVHFHGSEENFGLLAEKIDMPMCLSIQGMLSPYYYKLYSGYQRHDVCKIQPLRAKLMLDGIEAADRTMRKRAIREGRILKIIPNILGRTNWDRDCSLVFNPSRHYYVCNEILRLEFLNSNWSIPNSIQTLELTTTISNGLYKGFEVVIHTAQLLHNAKIKFQWNVIGLDSNDAFVKITRKLTKIRPEDVNVKLLGRKSAAEIVEILKASHLFIQVSHIENSPNSLCEAMALGMPIIASNAGGTSSMLQDRKEGVLVQDGDPYSLAGAIVNLWANYEDGINMGKRARSRALKRHNPDNVINELMAAYESIIS